MVVQKNLEKVRKLYEAAETTGDINAVRNFGQIYFESSGVQPDYVKAFQFFQRAAKFGDAAAQFDLAIAYFQGKGTERNDGEAIQSLLKSADQGYSKAAKLIADMKRVHKEHVRE